MPDLKASACFCAAYAFGDQIGSGDMHYHVVEHIALLEKYAPQEPDKERGAVWRTFAAVARDRGKAWGNPWL
jgi:hypothetical protein